jgi:putative endonuclease
MLYIGVTNDLFRRFYEHKNKLVVGHSQRYSMNRLVYYEETNDVLTAIEREKQLKRWRRDKKINLIEKVNPKFEDLSEGWYEDSNNE